MTDTIEKALSTNEVAIILNTTRQSVAKLCKLSGSNKLPHRKIGKHYRFAKSAVMAWLAGTKGNQLTKKPLDKLSTGQQPIPYDEDGIDHAAIAEYLDKLPSEADVLKDFPSMDELIKSLP